MSIGGSKKQKTTSTSTPWSGAVPYLTGEGGIFPESQNLYQSGQVVGDQMGAVNDSRMGQLQDRQNDGFYDAIIHSGKDAAGGYFSPEINKVNDVDRTLNVVTDNVTARRVNPGNVNINTARSDQGKLDPTQSLGNLLSGQVSNPYTQRTADAVTNNIGRNYAEQVMPGIRSGAVQSGQYGGSRQGIAEGLALSRMNQDIASATAPLYAQQHENSQNRMASVAGQLNSQAQNVAENNVNRNFQGQTINAQNQLQADTGNASRALQADLSNAQRMQQNNQFNANLGLQNNAQEMQRASQDVNTRMMGLNALGIGQGYQDQNYQNQLGALAQENDFDWNNLNRYSSIISPGAGLGGSTSGSQTGGGGTGAGLISGGIGGGLLASTLPAAGPWGIAAGAGLGALGSLF